MRLWCFDCYSGLSHNDSWGREVARAALLRGHQSVLFKTADTVNAAGYLFARRRQFPPLYDEDDRTLGPLRRPGLAWVQDAAQWRLYEDKVGQFEAFGSFMPGTLLARQPGEAVTRFGYPFISKTSTGSASHNVRVIRTEAEAQQEIDLAFGEGIPIRRGQRDEKQRGYLLWQEFIPHDVTWRVTAVGRQRHVYQRFCYPDKPVAAPASVVATQPAPMSPEVESLLEFSDAFFQAAGTQWCAIDVLKTEQGWRLLETSLAWARGNDPAGNAKFYGTPFSLNTQAELLIRELEAGVFGPPGA